MHLHPRPTSIVLALLLAAGVAGCGGDDGPEGVSQPAPSTSAAGPSPTTDARTSWLNAVNGMCTTLSGAASGVTYQASLSDNQISPAEHKAIAEQTKPATTAFDTALDALPVPSEAQPVKAAFDAFLVLQKASYAQLDQAAAANDQAALTKAYGVIQSQYATTPEGAALKSAGLSEKCSFRGTYPQS